jgi:hypothetical protein
MATDKGLEDVPEGKFHILEIYFDRVAPIARTFAQPVIDGGHELPHRFGPSVLFSR